MSFDLDKALRAISERQEPAMNDHPRIDPNSAQARISRAQAQEKALVEQIEMLHSLEDSDLKANRLSSAYDRLSELYAEQGRYDEAIDVTTNDKRRENYQAIKDALDSNATCDCSQDRAVALVKDASGKTQNQEVSLPVKTEVQKIVTENGLVSLTRCAKCGKLTANA